MRKPLYVIIFFLFSILVLGLSLRFNQTSASRSDINDSTVSELETAPFTIWEDDLPVIQAPADFDWRRLSGVDITFISENTPPTQALASNISHFERVTGIDVKIIQTDLDTLVQKVGLDFNAGAGKYDLIYADPYRVLSSYPDHLVDLKKMNQSKQLPHIPALNDFIKSQLTVLGYMGSTNHLYALPYDSPTTVLAYRKDVFRKYESLFMKEMGYDWTPDENMTWAQYYEIASWIQKKISAGVIDEVDYAIGNQAKQHDSLMIDFTNVLVAFGGSYYDSEQIGKLGDLDPEAMNLATPQGIRAARFYKKMLDLAAPESLTWGWKGVARAFASGKLAMSPQWHEYSAMFEDPSRSNVAGKVGWTLLPRGKGGHANMFGGTGIAINKDSNEEEKKAAWLFLIWATSPQVQYMTLRSDYGGYTPTRHSIYELPAIEKVINGENPNSPLRDKLLPMHAVLKAWKNENTYMRPKVPDWWRINTYIYTELTKMLRDKQSPKQTLRRIEEKVNH
ncbi:MAG TPA: extracellular solute-binding protein [Bacillales bacterium]|nr:extracellular solute-binding protein [Bacillales bacterium]